MVTTVGDEEQGNLLARELVGRRHAACVNMLPGVKSFYRWKGKICHDSEFLLIIKTMESEYDAVTATIQELHSYDLPEILAFPISQGEAGFPIHLQAPKESQSPFEIRHRAGGLPKL